MCQVHDIEGLPSPTPTTRYRSWKAKVTFLLTETLYYSIDVIIGKF